MRCICRGVIQLYWALSLKWMNVHWGAAPWMCYVISRVQWYKSCSLWNAEESSDSQCGYRRRSSFEYKLLLIWARPCHNNYQCLREKPDATQQLTAILNHAIGLKLECCLSDRPLLRLTTLAAWTCCLKRWNSQNLTLAVVNYLCIPPNGSLVWSVQPWHWAGNLTHILAVTESRPRPRTWCSLRECTKRLGNARLACFQGSPGGQHTPTYPGPAPTRGEKKNPP